MSKKPVLPRALARRDVQAAVDYHLREAGRIVALGFIDALETVYRSISAHPAAGSPRYANELALPGLRSRALKHYPYIANSDFHKPKHLYSWKTLLRCEKNWDAVARTLRANVDIALTLYRNGSWAA